MNDLRDHFEEIAGPMHAVDSKQAEADLARGRRALRRRRAVQACAGSAFGVAALTAAIAVATSTGAPTVPADKGTATVASVQLVAYKGEQPKGFTVDKVPDGWFVQASEQGYLTIAPEKAKNPGPDVNPSADPVYNEDSFVDKIAIMLESKDQSGPGREGKAVKVGDKNGVLLKGMEPADKSGDSGWTLWVEQPNGIYLLVQVWQGLGLTESQIVELGAGVHVHKDAVQGVG
ncbi:hypothetical protein [Paractinoplanes lichenicola]|uniref:Uncharacterized protein n=1 Tax=Paractinoplanes lichenicola TaxID=2802976 RepID=A0ABS1VRU0_9ACTN|nr:hypothetical protein [Actinoplanes lichenicola]MBL7257226.1 hypothetical protein [Actinoplanes lichenicola]